MKDITQFLGSTALAWTTAVCVGIWAVYVHFANKASVKAALNKTAIDTKKTELENGASIIKMQKEYITDLEKKHSDLSERYNSVIEKAMQQQERIHQLEIKIQQLSNQIALLSSKIKQQ